MSNTKKGLSRREFLSTSMGAALGVTGYSLVNKGHFLSAQPVKKKKIALVGTGIRGSSLWGKTAKRKILPSGMDLTSASILRLRTEAR